MLHTKDFKSINQLHDYYNAYGIREVFRERVEMLEEAERLLKVCRSKKMLRQIKQHHEYAKSEFIEFFNELLSNINSE